VISGDGVLFWGERHALQESVTFSKDAAAYDRQSQRYEPEKNLTPHAGANLPPGNVDGFLW
jgi:hypothetical protein